MGTHIGSELDEGLVWDSCIVGNDLFDFQALDTGLLEVPEEERGTNEHIVTLHVGGELLVGYFLLSTIIILDSAGDVSCHVEWWMFAVHVVVLFCGFDSHGTLDESVEFTTLDLLDESFFGTFDGGCLSAGH